SLVWEGLGARRPLAAWVPDSFGHSATAPDVFAALGYHSVGMSRLDGLRDGYEVNILHAEPLAAGSTAQALRDAGSADFIWRGAGGAEVLAHFMPIRNYCQGDTIDLSGKISGGDRIGTDLSDSPAYT